VKFKLEYCRSSPELYFPDYQSVLQTNPFNKISWNVFDWSSKDENDANEGNHLMKRKRRSIEENTKHEHERQAKEKTATAQILRLFRSNLKYNTAGSYKE